MTGGNVFHGNVDFGRSESASITGAVTNTYHNAPAASGDQLPVLIAELRRQIAAHDRVLQDVEGLRASVDMLQEQVATGQPAPSRLRALLTSMATMAGDVTAVSAAVTAVRDAIS